jgi:hypothetical protein
VNRYSSSANVLRGDGATMIHQSVISKIELGQRNVKFDTFHRIFAVLRLRMLPVPWHFMRTVGEKLDYNFEVKQPSTIAHTNHDDIEKPESIMAPMTL